MSVTTLFVMLPRPPVSQLMHTDQPRKEVLAGIAFSYSKKLYQCAQASSNQWPSPRSSLHRPRAACERTNERVCLNGPLQRVDRRRQRRRRRRLLLGTDLIPPLDGRRRTGEDGGGGGGGGASY